MTALPATLSDRSSLRPAALLATPSRDISAALQRLLLGWLVLRTALWTLLATLQPNPALDTVEWLAWGRHWQLGYHKHPPLAAWLAELAWRLTPGSFAGVYLLGYLALAVALYAVWAVAREVLPPRAAFASVLSLDGLAYLGSYGTEFNNQVLLVAFWALTITCFYRASTRDRWRDWAAAGLMLGLALLCKYSAVTLLVPLLAWRLWSHGLRRWQRPAVLLLVAGLVFLPHLVWLVQNDFPTLRYAARRLHAAEDAPDPRLSAIVFVFSQSLRLLPVALILLPVLRRRRRLDSPARVRSLFAFAVLGPVALTLALSLFGKTQLRDIWGAPLWTFAPMLLLAHVRTDDTGRGWRRLRLAWAGVTLCTLLTALIGDLYGSALRGRPLRIHYPGALLAEEVTARYAARHGRPPAVIAGDWWLAANVCCLAEHRPALYGSREPSSPGLDARRLRRDPRQCLEPERAACRWSNDGDLARRGGVLLWSAEVYGEDLPDWLQRRFPAAQSQRALRLPYAGGSSRELCVGWAMVPPGS